MTRDAIIEMARSLCRTACEQRTAEDCCNSCPLNERETISVDVDLYNQEEIYENCTVQVLTNTATGKVSVGWWKNEEG